MTQKDVAPVLQQHKDWVNNRQGKKADLRGADLRKIKVALEAFCLQQDRMQYRLNPTKN
jgi:hypothetical protein